MKTLLLAFVLAAACACAHDGSRFEPPDEILMKGNTSPVTSSQPQTPRPPMR